MPNLDSINNQNDNSFRNSFDSRLNQYKKPKKKRFWKWLIILLIILGGVFAFASTSLLSRANSIFTNKQSIFTRFGKLLVSEDVPLQGEEQGRVNILLLGMGGPGHEGPLLTDTMIVASINTKTWEVGLVSIPRDFMVRLEGRGFNKINAAYAYAEQDEENSGGDAAIKVAEYATGLDIHYYAAVDFKGFVKAVDQVGGLDITIDRTFTDSSYPDYRYGYLPPVTFTKGQEHMNGERALIFARSRKGNNGEGSDFARSERQKKIMLAFKNEVLKLNVTDIGTINNLLSAFTENFRTSMEPHELKRVADLSKNIVENNVFSISLDPDAKVICDGLFDLATGRPAPPPAPVQTPETDEESEEGEETPATTQTSTVSRIYVVVPCAGKSIADVHAHLATSMQLANLQKEAARIEVINSTGKSSVTTSWRTLSDHDMEVKFSTTKTPLDRTILYDNTKGAKPKTLEYIKSHYNVTVSDLPYTQSTSDFVIIIGNDALTP